MKRERGVYVILFHGRKTPDEQLEDWGEDGPVLGPFSWAHQTYCWDLKLGDLAGDDSVGELIFFEELAYYDGMFYGDLSITAEPTEDELARVVEFDESKAKLPVKYSDNAAAKMKHQLMALIVSAAQKYVAATIADTDRAVHAKGELQRAINRANTAEIIGQMVGCSVEEGNLAIKHGMTGAHIARVHDELAMIKDPTGLDAALMVAAKLWLLENRRKSA